MAKAAEEAARTDPAKALIAYESYTKEQLRDELTRVELSSLAGRDREARLETLRSLLSSEGVWTRPKK